MFVVRETFDPKKDLQRNWSAPAGGGHTCPLSEESKEAAFQKWFSYSLFDDEAEARKEAPEFRFHNGIGGWCEVHYEGLGAWKLSALNIEEAVREATGMDGLAVTMSEGDGHFFAEDVVSYHHVEKNLFIFNLKS